MCDVIDMSTDHWESRGFALNNRSMFNDFLREFIAMRFNSYDECIKNELVINFPNILNKGARYIIHKFTIRNHFEPVSHDTENGRMMYLRLSKKYIGEIMMDYPFEPVIQHPIPVPKTDKQLLFDSIIGFIHQNLENELNEYINNI